MTPDRHPHLAAALPVFTSTDFTAHFEFGLALLIEGLRAMGPAATPSGPGATSSGSGATSSGTGG